MTADRPIAMSSRPRLYQYENVVAIPLRSLISSAAEKANMRMAETRTPWRTGRAPTALDEEHRREVGVRRGGRLRRR